MKLTPAKKKVLILAGLVLMAVILSGCAIPRDENGQTIYFWFEQVEGYTVRTSFKEVMANESWFSAILVYPLSMLINRLAPVISVGGAIAVVTVLVNGILGALTIKSSIAMQQMQLIQPELDRINRKYEGRDDQNSKMRQANEMQALYRKYDINPGSAILITFIQFPVIMAMYMSVHRSFAVATGTFLGMDLQLTPLQGIKNVLAGDMSGLSYFLLWAFMGVCQFVSMKIPQILQKRSLEADAAKHHRRAEAPKNNQNMIMQIYMMGMIMVFGLMWPSAMSLYWAINSIVNIVKTMIVQKIIDNKKAASEGVRA